MLLVVCYFLLLVDAEAEEEGCAGVEVKFGGVVGEVDEDFSVFDDGGEAEVFGLSRDLGGGGVEMGGDDGV